MKKYLPYLNILGAAAQQNAFFRQRHTAASAAEQIFAKLIFQLLHLFGKCRLRHMKHLCGGSHAPLACNLQKIT